MKDGFSKKPFMKYDDTSVKINELNIELITFSFLSFRHTNTHKQAMKENFYLLTHKIIKTHKIFCCLLFTPNTKNLFLFAFIADFLAAQH